jgi:hypothetical protein
VTRVRRGGYVFITWVGDHSPRHVHVLRDGRQVLKWNLDRHRPMEGVPTAKLVALIRELESEGLL